jgi:hypothetical protein
VQKQLGNGDLGDLFDGREPGASNPTHRYIRIELLPPVEDRSESSLDYQAPNRHPAGEIHGDGRTQGMAEYDDPVRWYPSLIAEIAIGGISILVQSRFGGYTLTLAVAPIIKGEKIETQPAQPGVVHRSVELREIPRVAMTDQEPEPVRVWTGRDDPARQHKPVFS